MRRFLAVLLLFALAACRQAEPVNPALWQVTGPNGERGWLFGTIHLLPNSVDWRTGKVDEALKQTDLLVLEIARIDDTDALRRQFEAAAHSPGLPPLSQRVDPALRPALAKLLREAGAKEEQFADVETWAAALMLASATVKDADPGNGIDRALVEALPALPRTELEGGEAQYRIFDQLPEQDQRDLLASTLKPSNDEADEAAMADAWKKGDMARIAHETHTGMLADPGLRQALYTGRNLDWVPKVEALLKAGKRPFVAVGAAHLAGEDALPALLVARGWKVERVQ